MTSPLPSPITAAAVKAALTYGLAEALPWPHQPMTAVEFSELLQVGSRDRLLGTIAEAVSDGALPVTDPQLTELTEEHTRWMTHVLGAERLLVQVVERFDERNIDCRVLKGFALGHMLYRDPAWRISTDLDLLVPGAQFAQAVDLVTSEFAGVATVEELRPGFDQEFGKEVTLRVGAVEVDLHRTFVAGPFGLMVDLDELFEDGTDFVIGDQTVRTLAPEHQFIHSCYNAALGDYPVRLGALRDLLVCWEHSNLDPGEVAATAHRWRANAVVRRAMQLSVEATDGHCAPGVIALMSIPVSRTDDWLLRSYVTSARSYWRPLASFAVIGGVRARVRYAAALLAPSRSYLKSRGWSARTYLTRALRGLRRNG